MSFEPTHRVGAAAIPTWPTADRSQAPGPDLSAGLEVELIDRQGDLSKVRCSNEWEAWVLAATLEPLAPAAAPPPPAPTTPPGPPSSEATAAARSPRPAWLLPAAIAAVAAVLIAVFVAQGGDDDAKDTVSATATTKATIATKDLAAISVLPSIADVSVAAGGNWIEAEGDTCEAEGTGQLAGGDDCAGEDDSFDFLCADENLEEFPAASRATKTARVKGTGQSLEMKARVYLNERAAENALEFVQAAFTGPCRGDEDSTSVMSPLAIDDIGDEHVAGTEVDIDNGNKTDHVFVRAGRVVVSFELRDGDALPKTLFRDLGQSVAARAR